MKITVTFMLSLQSPNPLPFLVFRVFILYYSHSFRLISHLSCNRQIASSELLSKGEDVTRSMVQKAVVILAAKPVFGAVRSGPILNLFMMVFS